MIEIIGHVLIFFISSFSLFQSENMSLDSEINVYIFKGEGCSYCDKALNFFESIEEKYGKYFNLIEYEVWYNQENAELMEEVGGYLGVSVSGVPFIVVGNNIYPGFEESFEEDIIDTILSEYEKKVDDRFDVMEKLGYKNNFLFSFVSEDVKDSLEFIIYLIRNAVI